MTTPHRAKPEHWAALEEQSAPEYDRPILELRARVEALEAAQQQQQQAASVADDDEPQTIHTIALGMVDTLEQLNVLPEILDTLRRAIREPMQHPTSEAAPVATDGELVKTWDTSGKSIFEKTRAIYDLGREHGAICPHIRSSGEGTSYCALAEQTAPAPAAALSDALIKAECALADIAEGEPNTDEGDPVQWAEQRCADALAIIRPVMRQHGIRTSEWPPAPQPNPPAKPQPHGGRLIRDDVDPGRRPTTPAGSLVERVAIVCATPCKWTWDDQARAAIREVAAWLRAGLMLHAAELLEQEAKR